MEEVDEFSSEEPELVGSNPEHRNWKGMIISIAVIMVVIGLVVISVVLLTPENTMPAIPNVNLSDIMEERWKLPKDIWVGDDLIYNDVSGNIVRMSSSNNRLEILISRQTLRDNGIVDYKISENAKYALLVYNKVPLYTHSYNASYYVYNIQTRNKEPLIHAASESTFQFAGFGKTGNSIIYSLDGDLYHKADVNDEAKRLTYGGSFGNYHNGIADWLYEEKILKSSVAHWWSPSGRHLAYASFDDRKVEDSYVTIYTGDDTSDIMTYTKEAKYKYPKAGYANPIVRIHVINMKTMEQVTFMEPTWPGHSLDMFHSLTWLSHDELVITWSNRNMTASVMQQCFPTNSTCMNDVIRQQKETTSAGRLTNLNHQALPSEEPGIFFYILPSNHGAMGEFNHLALVNKTQKSSSMRYLTEGNWEVIELIHYDQDTRSVYYISNERNVGSRHVFRVGFDSVRECVTCNMESRAASPRFSVGKGNKRNSGIKKCQYFKARFGGRSDIFSVHCLGPGVPCSGIVRINQTASSASTVQILQPPDRTLNHFVLPSTRYDTIIAEDGTDIRTKTLVPATLHVGKRPVVFFKDDVGSQTVDLKFRPDLASYLVKSIGAVAIFIDGRGSGGRGNQMLHQAAGNPGVFEIQDMKSVLKHLKDEENVDTENVAVVGTSGYGGFLAALSLTHSEFKCAVARSPVTNWYLYDSFGSESLLGSPSENPLVYQKANLLHLIEGIADSKLRIYHGMQNRKVNMQHSVLLKQASMLTDLPLDSVDVTYHPSMNSISKNEATKIESNIYESISLFLRNCLFGDSEAGLIKLELLETNYGISS